MEAPREKFAPLAVRVLWLVILCSARPVVLSPDLDGMRDRKALFPLPGSRLPARRRSASPAPTHANGVRQGAWEELLPAPGPGGRGELELELMRSMLPLTNFGQRQRL
jgi:hypothetical protein